MPHRVPHPERADYAARGLSSHGTPYTKGPYKNSPPGATGKRLSLRERNKAAGLTIRGTVPKRITTEPRAATLARSAACIQRRQTEQQNAADRADAERRDALAHSSDARVIAYRDEKANASKRLAVKLADAKREYERQQAAIVDTRRAGRPRKHVNVKIDPRDALLVALEGQQT